MSGELILVVEDNPDMAALVVEEILPALGYKALAASNAQEGLEKVRGHKPDLMLLDLMLPDIDGFSLLRLLTEEGISQPTILVTNRPASMMPAALRPAWAWSLCTASTM